MTSLGSRSRRLLGGALATVLAGLLEVALRTLPVPRVIRLCGLRPVPLDAVLPGGAPPPRVRSRAALVRRAAARLGGRPRCLAQALTLVLLARRGAPALTLHLGVARDAVGALQAHAWVRHGETIVIGGEEAPRFVEVERFGLVGGPLSP